MTNLMDGCLYSIYSWDPTAVVSWSPSNLDQEDNLEDLISQGCLLQNIDERTQKKRIEEEDIKFMLQSLKKYVEISEIRSM